MVVAELIIKVEGGDVDEKEVRLENGKMMSLRDEQKQPFKMEWSDDEVDKVEDQSDMAVDSDNESKDILKTEPLVSSLVPSSPLPSPSKAEEVEYDQNRSSSSRQTSLLADTPRNGAKKLGSGPTQFAKHLPRSEGKALKTFEVIKGNVYQNAKVGRSKGHEKEAMVCDCRYRHGIDPEAMACTDEAECINRLTQVECLKSECQCGTHCQNQRFQRGQYADLEIIETEKKGFGLRAGDDISADQFVYEYIGEVVEQKEFMKRMQDYRMEGIRHFYFMMLQREEFLDATRKGCIARFVNHSCNPNCYVSKWHVGKYMRMGIFAKRDIEKGEELTFNYNVDRYGNDAQPCYCGEPNCVGSIGGKTQTDIGGMSQLFIDALGIADEVDQLEAKGTRKKKGRRLDEDFTPLLRPIEEEAEIAKVITAVRQASSNRNILQKLLSRIHMTQDAKVQRSLVRLHGFVLMASIIEEWKDDKEIVLLAMGSLARWPLSAKNKVVDSGIDRLVQDLTKQDDAEVSSLAKDLLSAWDALEMSYRIARKEASATTDNTSPGVSSTLFKRKVIEPKAPNSVSNRLEAVAPVVVKSTPRSNYLEVDARPQRKQESPFEARPLKKARIVPPPLSIEEIIRKANERQEEEAAAARVEAEQRAKAEEAARSASSNGRLSASNGIHGDSKSPVFELDERLLKEADLRLKELVSKIVVKYMSRYTNDLDKATFKKHARELTHIICDKEKRSTQSWPPPDGLASGFSKEKTKKIKDFALQYTEKLVARKRKAKTADDDSRADVSNGPFVPVTPPRPNSQSNGQPQLASTSNEDNASSIHEDTLTSLDRSNTPVSHSTNGAKGSDRTETSIEEERTNNEKYA